MHPVLMLAVATAVSAMTATRTATMPRMDETHMPSKQTPATFPQPSFPETFAMPQSTSSTGSSSGGSLNSDSEADSICSPLNSSQLPDLSAPCNVATLIMYECIYGVDGGFEMFDPNGMNMNMDMEPQADEVQRICACESQYFDELNGCATCVRAHGSDEAIAFLAGAGVSAMSRGYCAASKTPSTGLEAFVTGWTDGKHAPPNIKSSIGAKGTSSISDPLRGSTEVSLYYTPSVTGVAAYKVANTITGIASTSNGQIVATAKPHALLSTTSSDVSSSGGNAVLASAAATAMCLAAMLICL